MSAKSRNAIAGFALLVVVGASLPAAAQTPTPTQTGPSALPSASAPPRIEVYPRPLLYRRCVDWYEIQHRPSGTVLYPAKHCWWVRG
jgi:hypothetical protein